jgi:hypothetical protein
MWFTYEGCQEKYRKPTTVITVITRYVTRSHNARATCTGPQEKYNIRKTES